jgi:predicted nucleic acid-binding protein
VRFLDTNILLYAVSSNPHEASKAARAIELLQRRDLALSAQVLQEFYVQATRATAPVRLSHSSAVDFIATLLRYPVQAITVEIVRSALSLAARYQINYWDAAIVAAAGSLSCDVLYSEDLQDGQDFERVSVVNPFAT